MFHKYRTKEAKNIKKALKSKIVPCMISVKSSNKKR